MSLASIHTANACPSNDPAVTVIAYVVAACITIGGKLVYDTYDGVPFVVPVLLFQVNPGPEIATFEIRSPEEVP